ncbi:MAG: hypothetical protein RL077_397 [Verrucomicrobiota bacterium]|jgi:hypothetical protein
MFRRFFAGLAGRKWCEKSTPDEPPPGHARIAASNGSIANFRAKRYSTFARWLNDSLAENAQISIYFITTIYDPLKKVPRDYALGPCFKWGLRYLATLRAQS